VFLLGHILRNGYFCQSGIKGTANASGRTKEKPADENKTYFCAGVGKC
jgi:hypothetical protein